MKNLLKIGKFQLDIDPTFKNNTGLFINVKKIYFLNLNIL